MTARTTRWTATLLLSSAALDLARCGLSAAASGPAVRTALLIGAGSVAAVVSIVTAHGFVRRKRWVAWPALLIGVGSAPQAAATGFHAGYAVPDIATAAVGLLLTLTLLAGDLLIGRTQETGSY
jgi:hypothetical protein